MPHKMIEDIPEEPRRKPKPPPVPNDNTEQPTLPIEPEEKPDGE